MVRLDRQKVGCSPTAKQAAPDALRRFPPLDLHTGEQQRATVPAGCRSGSNGKAVVPLLKTKGFACHVDEAVFGTGREGYAHLLSLVGSREAVKAIWARLMKGETTVLHDEVRTWSVRMDPQDGGKLLSERLPSGAFHGLLLSKTVLRGELVICEHEEDLPGRFYTLLSRQLRLPLHNSWKTWLWENALAEEMVKKLRSQRLHAYELKLAVVNLEQAVRMALIAGELPEVEVLRAA